MMEGHTNNLSFAVFHPNLPTIISGSEDGTVKIWNSNTYRLENTLSYALEQACMDPTGKLIYACNQLVLSGNVQSCSEDATAEGNHISLMIKEISTMEIFGSNLICSSDGQFMTVVGDGEYIIYTALAWRNKHQRQRVRGVLGLGEWGLIYWSGTGSLVAITLEESFYFLCFDQDAYNAKLKKGVDIMDEGFEEAFDVMSEVFHNPSNITRSVTTAKWVGDCFIYTTAGSRINYLSGNKSYTMSPSDMYYIVGYIRAHNWVHLADKDMNIYGYASSLSVVEYQMAVLHSDMEAAAEILPTLPKEQLNKLDDLDAAVEIMYSIPGNEAETKLLLLMGDQEGLKQLAATVEKNGTNNLAFVTLFQLGDMKACLDLLMKMNRAPEVALFAWTYAPSLAPHVADVCSGPRTSPLRRPYINKCSRAVSWASMVVNCRQTPSAKRALQRMTLPPSGAFSRDVRGQAEHVRIMLNVVVLPALLGPSTANITSLETPKETSSTTLFPSKDLVT
ncbi:coatomer WD associated region-domain-containing protein [Boletus coccyginus]|nr:coatomer WD associated region-domain-containing protein [Boletus coccyginus]